jgi:hypothetical protein
VSEDERGVEAEERGREEERGRPTDCLTIQLFLSLYPSLYLSLYLLVPLSLT